jgi:hypothetical protein
MAIGAILLTMVTVERFFAALYGLPLEDENLRVGTLNE